MNALILAASLFVALLQVIQPPQPQRPGPPASAPPRDQNQAPTGSGILRGHILRADQRPLPLAQVRLQIVDGSQPSIEAIADENGRYEFLNVPAGRYRLIARRPGYIAIEFGQRRPLERGRPIVLGVDETLERVDIVLPRHGAVEGRVVDESGDPVEGATIRVLRTGFDKGRRRLAPVSAASARRTDDLGRYRIYGLQPGQYVISALVGPPGQVSTQMPGYVETYYPGTPRLAEAQAVAVGLSEEVTSLDFRLSRVGTARVTGMAFTSTGEPIQGGLILSASERSGAVAPSPMGARINIQDGSFEFLNVPPGEYAVQAFKPRVNPSTEGEFATTFVSVNGSDVTDLVLQMTPGSTIIGRVTLDGSGTLRPNAVELTPVPLDLDLSPLAAGPPARAEIYADWSFALAGLHGVRRLRLTRAPAGWALKGIYVNGLEVTDTPLSFGTSDQSLKDVEVVLTSRAPGVSGSVTDDRGRALSDQSIVVFARDSDLWYPDSRFLGYGTTKPDGTFVVRRLPPGEYYVATYDRIELADSENEWQAAEFLESLAPRAMKLTLSEGQKVSLALMPAR